MDIFNEKERNKYIVIRQLVSGRITAEKVAQKLGITRRTIFRLKKKYVEGDKEAFCHKGNGRTSPRILDQQVESEIVGLYEENYMGFNFMHFYEYVTRETNQLSEITGLIPPPCKRTVFRVLKRNGIKSPQSKKENREKVNHPRHPRRSQFGELIQLDGSLYTIG
jgi:transposase